jgi:hypothetical protein
MVCWTAAQSVRLLSRVFRALWTAVMERLLDVLRAAFQTVETMFANIVQSTALEAPRVVLNVVWCWCWFA